MITNKSTVKAVCADADSNKPVTPGQDNSFDRALGRAVELVQEGGKGGRISCTNALLQECYTLFRIRVASVCRNRAGLSQALMDEVVQECVVNFWQSLEKGGAMADRLASLKGRDLRAYLAGMIQMSSRQRLRQAIQCEARQRGYLVPPASMVGSQESSPEDNRTWWEVLLEAAWSAEHRPECPAISPLDLEEALLGKAAGTWFEAGLIEAAAEFLGSSGHGRLADLLVETVKALAAGKAKERAEKKRPSRTAQRRRMENKQRLGRDLEI